MSTPTAFPSRIEDLGPGLLTEVLARRAPGTQVEDVTVVETKYAGEGVASTADRVILDVRYGPSSPPGLPTRLVLKTMLVGPHAPPEMYETEVRFYAEIRPHTDVEAPRSYGESFFSHETAQFGVLMEDLRARDARFPNATESVTLGEVRSLLEQLARLHATYWSSPRFTSDLAWIPTPTRGGMNAIFTKFGCEFAQSQVDQHPFKQEQIAPLGLSVKELWALLARARDAQESRPATLLHGDTHIGNTYLLPGERGGLLDWQLMTRGPFEHDVIYLLMTALPTENRRTHQADLLRHYLGELGRAGVQNVPSEDEAWGACRRAALWGLVIGWLLCPPANYGVEITKENIARTVAAVQDFDTIRALREGV